MFALISLVALLGHEHALAAEPTSLDLKDADAENGSNTNRPSSGGRSTSGPSGSFSSRPSGSSSSPPIGPAPQTSSPSTRAPGAAARPPITTAPSVSRPSTSAPTVQRPAESRPPVGSVGTTVRPSSGVGVPAVSRPEVSRPASGSIARPPTVASGRPTTSAPGSSSRPETSAPAYRPSTGTPSVSGPSVSRPAVSRPVVTGPDRPDTVVSRPSYRPGTTYRPGGSTTVIVPDRAHGSGGVVVRRYGPGRVISPPPRVVMYRQTYRPWHGVFVYGPAPQYHVVYRDAPAPMEVREEHLPERRVDRDDSLAIGVRSGSYLSGYEGGSTYGDLGLGLTARYRPEEAIGIEGVLMHHNETFDGNTERAQTVGQASVMLFANPWGRTQPYVLGGLSANARSIDDGFYQDGVATGLRTNDLLWGPHAGAGVEFAFGQKAALDLEVRYVGWMNAGGDDPTASGALMTNAAFVVHF